MARPIKKGLDYFPLDVGFSVNDKTEAIMNEFGPKGVVFMIYLLSAVYQNGYYLQWDRLKQNQLANRIPGFSRDLANQIVNRLIIYGTFSEELFNSAKVLTSQRIQETYIDATKRRKTPKPTLYWINVNINSDSSEVNDDINPQSKVKESKGNKSKEKHAHSAEPKYAPTDEPYKIAKHLLEAIRTNNSDFNPKFDDKGLQRWANDIRLAHERDGRDYDKLDHMVDWCQNNDFWQANILSGKKLREQYDHMAAQANADARRKSKGYGGHPVRKEIVPKWAQKGASQTGSKSKGKELTDEERQELAERVANL